ncbi:MAG: DUF6798 domain-containing protein [Pirellulaceae bacterium]
MLSFLALLLTWVMLLGSTRCDRRLLVVHLAALGSLGLCAIGVGLDRAISAGWSPERGASLLRFYWFREADVLVPIAVSLAAVRGLESWRAWPRSIQIAALPFGALGVLIVCGTVLEQRGDGRPRADQQTLPTSPDQTNSREILDDWRQVGQWFQNETPAGTLVITPREQQTFKWYAQPRGGELEGRSPGCRRVGAVAATQCRDLSRGVRSESCRGCRPRPHDLHR